MVRNVYKAAGVTAERRYVSARIRSRQGHERPSSATIAACTGRGGKDITISAR